MDGKASPDETLPTRTEAEDLTVDLPEGSDWITSGQLLSGGSERTQNPVE